MNDFLNALNKDTESGQYFRKFITDRNLTDLIDNVNNGTITDENKIANIERLVKMKLGRPVLVQQIINSYSKNTEVDITPENIVPEPINPKPINPEVIAPKPINSADNIEEKLFKQEKQEEQGANNPTKPIHEVKLAYGTKAMQEMGSFEGEGNYEEGCDVNLSATANEGFKFSGWKLNGRGDMIAENPLIINGIDGNKTYKAYFEAIKNTEE